MTPQAERWAEALQIQRMYGTGAVAWTAERIAVLARTGDAAGVARFTDIAEKLDSLRSGSLQ